MADKDKMVDFPDYDPNERVSFPPKPGTESPFGKTPPRKEADTPKKEPYYNTYNPDPPTADPSQTKPGAPDIRDPDTRLPKDANLAELSPDIEHKK